MPYSTQQVPTGIGNIVTTGVQLYRSRFRDYLAQALWAHLWLFIPIFGWAKFFAGATLIAQSAFQDLTEQSASLPEINSKVQRYQWQLLRINFLILILVTVLIIAVLFIFGILLGIASVIFGFHVPKISSYSEADKLIIGGIELTFMIGVGLWRYTKFFIVEVVAVTEDQFQVRKILDRCKQLVKGSFWTALGVILVTFLLTFPLSYIVATLVSRLLVFPIRPIPISRDHKYILHYICVYLLMFSTVITTFPLWQTTKAALYYVLRCRQEGFDLQLRDRD